MKIEITTSAKNVEIANYILEQAATSLDAHPKTAKSYGVSNGDIEKIRRFRRSLVRAFTKAAKQGR